MTTAAITYIALTFLGLGVNLTRDGNPRAGNHSFWWSVVGSSVTCGLLYWGGFFAKVAV